MASTLTPYPPHKPQSTTPLTPAAALANLQSYLSQSETTPHLHPDAQLNPESIKFSTTGGPAGGLVLHNVRRVHKGLSGEVLAPEEGELNEIFGGDDARLDALAAETESAGKRKGGLKKTSAYEDAGAVSAEEWARSQLIIEGDVGERDPAAGVQEGYAEDMEVDGGEEEAKSARDKAARKEEKKRRMKAEKRDKEAKRANK